MPLQLLGEARGAGRGAVVGDHVIQIAQVEHVAYQFCRGIGAALVAIGGGVVALHVRVIAGAVEVRHAHAGVAVPAQALRVAIRLQARAAVVDGH